MIGPGAALAPDLSAGTARSAANGGSDAQAAGGDFAVALVAASMEVPGSDSDAAAQSAALFGPETDTPGAADVAAEAAGSARQGLPAAGRSLPAAAGDPGNGTASPHGGEVGATTALGPTAGDGATAGPPGQGGVVPPGTMSSGGGSPGVAALATGSLATSDPVLSSRQPPPPAGTGSGAGGPGPQGGAPPVPAVTDPDPAISGARVPAAAAPPTTAPDGTIERAGHGPAPATQALTAQAPTAQVPTTLTTAPATSAAAAGNQAAGAGAALLPGQPPASGLALADGAGRLAGGADQAGAAASAQGTATAADRSAPGQPPGGINRSFPATVEPATVPASVAAALARPGGEERTGARPADGAAAADAIVRGTGLEAGIREAMLRSAGAAGGRDTPTPAPATGGESAALSGSASALAGTLRGGGDPAFLDLPLSDQRAAELGRLAELGNVTRGDPGSSPAGTRGAAGGPGLAVPGATGVAAPITGPHAGAPAPGGAAAELNAEGLLRALDAPFQSPRWDAAVAQRLTLMARHGLRSAELTLNPPELGRLEVRVAVQQDQASVSFVSAHAAVREALEASQPRLRELLGDGGFDLVNVDVSDDHGGAQGGERSAPESSPAARSSGESESTEAPVASPEPAANAPGSIDFYA